MSKLKNIAVFMLLISILVSSPACSSNPPGTTGPTITVTDSIGREVEVPENVERIAALYSFAGYAVCVLGGGNALVAVPSGLKRDILLVEIFPEIANASVPRQGGTINAEELQRIDPDVVIVRNDTVADEKELEKLDRTGIPYIVIDFSTMEQQRQAIDIIGTAIGKSTEAAAFNDYYVDLIERVDDVVGDMPEGEKLRLHHAENEALRATHQTSVVADWTSAAGVINVSEGQDLQLFGNDYYASIEQILLWDPEVTIVNEPAAYSLITGSEQWSGITSVQEGRVYQLPNGITRWGHPGSIETPLALLWTAKTVYPDMFTNVDMEEEVYYFYNTFFSLELDEEMIETVLEGGDLREPK